MYNSLQQNKKIGNEKPVRFYHVHLALLLAGKQG